MNFSKTRLYDYMKIALRDPQLLRPESENEPEMLSVEQFKLMCDLYQFLPSKKGGSAAGKVPMLELNINKRRQSAMA